MKKYTKSQLRAKIDNFFDLCDTANEKGLVKCFTVSGLCLYIGVSRAELEKLASDKKTAQVVSEAKLRIENYIEERLLIGDITATAAIIALKYNFGWTDKVRRDEGPVEIQFSDFVRSEFAE